MKSVTKKRTYYCKVTANRKPITKNITYRWVQSFTQVNNLIIYAQTGKLMMGPQKQEVIEKATSFHLGNLKWTFDNKALDKYLISNADETHFISNMDDGCTIGVRGDWHVKYADVVRAKGNHIKEQRQL